MEIVRRRFALRVLALLTLLTPPLEAATDAPRLVGPFAKDEYPQAVIDRPLTLPAGMVEGEIGASFVSQRFELQPQAFAGADDWYAGVLFRVGITDRIQVETGTAFSLDQTLRRGGRFHGVAALETRPTVTSWQRVVPVRLSLLALDTETLVHRRRDALKHPAM